MATPTFFGHNSTTASGGGGGGPASGDVLASQVLDWQPEESAADVGASPNNIQMEVFS